MVCRQVIWHGSSMSFHQPCPFISRNSTGPACFAHGAANAMSITPSTLRACAGLLTFLAQDCCQGHSEICGDLNVASVFCAPSKE